MTEKDLTTEFTFIYPDLAVYTRKALWALHSRLEPNECLSECFLYCHSVRDQIETSSDLQAYAKNWIRQNIIWKNSPLKRLVSSDHPDYLDTPGYDTPDPEAVIRLWRDTLTSYESALWCIWHERGLRKGREVAEHLGISLSSAYLVLKECRHLEGLLSTYIKTNY